MEQRQFYHLLWRILLKGIATSIALKAAIPLTIGTVGLVLKSLESDAQYQVFSRAVETYGPNCLPLLFADAILAGWVWEIGENSYFNPIFFALLCQIALVLSLILQGLLVTGITRLFHSMFGSKHKRLTQL